MAAWGSVWITVTPRTPRIELSPVSTVAGTDATAVSAWPEAVSPVMN